jgi:hypothetical protein
MKVTRALMILAVCTLLVTGLSCGSGGSDTYQLTTVIEGEGSVSPSSGGFATGSIVTLTASPASDWAFTHWGGNANGSENIVNITMDSDKTVYAYFTNNSISMPTPTPSPISTSIPTPTASPSLSDGSIDIASTPSGAAIYVDDVNTGSVTPLTINVAEGNHSIKLTLYHYIDKTGTVTINAGTTTAINWPMTSAPALTLTIQPDEDASKDTYVYRMSPGSNYDSDDILAVDQTEYYYETRSYIQFNLSLLPSSAVITDARLGLYYVDSYLNSVPASIGAYKVTGDWNASTITWNNKPAHATSAASIITVPADPTHDFIYWDITDLVKGWFKGSVTNNGLVLAVTDENNRDGLRYFCSSVVSNAFQRPKLEITYFNPSPSILPINISIFH